MPEQPADRELVAWFETLGSADVPRVGGKNASLGEMMRGLAASGVRVPDGFATTTDAFRAYVEANGIGGRLGNLMAALRDGRADLRDTGEAARRLFLEGEFPPAVAEEIRQAYRELSRRSGVLEASVAVRSSATAEDLPDASFAGQQETFLNVRGESALLDACRRCYASLFTDRAIAYRQAKGFDRRTIALSVGVQRMVRSDIGAAGVMFSIDTETGFPRVAVISAAWGLGETVVQGTVDPDKYMVFKPALADTRLAPIIEKTLGGKEHKLVYAGGGSARTATVPTTRKERQAFVLSDDDILQLARWAVAVEAHYGRPMDMEWARDGETGELSMVQARPETVQSRRGAGILKTYRLKGRGKVLLTGSAIGEAIATGTACVLRTAGDIERFRDGAVLVAEMTDPDLVPVMKRAAGIVTDHGGPTSHAAIVS
ncbi:MAG: PEP/pyruvate-binding domain-containing protein, partial [Ramlibacter sp.]